jgi:Fe2+ transport system protein B
MNKLAATVLGLIAGAAVSFGVCVCLITIWTLAVGENAPRYVVNFMVGLVLSLLVAVTAFTRSVLLRVAVTGSQNSKVQSGVERHPGPNLASHQSTTTNRSNSHLLLAASIVVATILAAWMFRWERLDENGNLRNRFTGTLCYRSQNSC